MYPTIPFKMPETRFEVRKPPVRLGEDNEYIYRQVLKISPDEYDHLKALGQIGMDFSSDVP